jgi:soluble lytic murein transglycosylase
MTKRIHLKLLVSAVATASFAAGCNLNSEPPQYVIVTGEPSQAPTLPPVATIPPTATVEPAIILRLGDRYLLNGYFENAAATYGTLVKQDGTAPEDKAAAAYGLAQSALREGLFSDAVDALNTFIDQFPQDVRHAQAYFLRGDAYLGMSRWSEAIADFQQYLAQRPGLIDSYAYERIGDAQLALGQSEEALASYGKSADASRETVSLLALRERVAQVYATAGRTADAVAQYDAILDVAQNAPYRAVIALRAAQTLVDAGDMQNGLVRMMQVFTGYPDRPEAYQAMKTLLDNDVALDSLAQGKVAYAYGDYQAAIAALNAYTESHISDVIPAEVLLMLGRAYREIGNTQAALTNFQTIITQYTTDDLFGEALLEQGRTRFLNNDNAGAIEQYMKIGDTYDYLPQAPEALWRAGYLYSQTEQPDLARSVFERLADRYPNTQQAKDGLFLAASLAYNADDLRAAERYYAELSVKTTGDERATAYFWVGRLALQRGDQKTAGEAFAQAANAAPDSYFAARSKDLVAGLTPFAKPAQEVFQFDDAAQIAQAEDWIRTTYNIEQEGALWHLTPELENDPRLVRGRELWDVAQYEQAIAEFDDLINANMSNALASYQLAIYFRGIGAYRSSVVAASYVIRNAQIGTLEAPPYIARMRYPAYYLDVVQDVGSRRDIDPLLLFSLIRHESLFDTYASGGAAEIGLMQVVPSTAEYIEGELGWGDYKHTDLYRPYAGIEFGSFYLEEQLRRFDENVPAALAGYNAGPGRAINWLNLAGSDPDQFMTAIDISSTRMYVQTIYGYYTIYRALYGQD